MICKSCGNELPAGSVFCMYCGARQVRAPRKKDEIKIPKAVQLPSGKWRVQLRAEGQSKTFGTEEEANAWAKAVRAGFLEAKKSAPRSLTLRSAINGFISRRGNTLSPATIMGYTVIRDNRFKRVMDLPAAGISDWQKIVNEEAKLCSPKTLKNAWMFVAMILREQGADVPKISLPKVVRKEHPWLEPNQIPVFVRALRGTPVEIPALLGLHSLRRSEMCALTWEDNIDLENRRIYVSGALVPDKDGVFVRKNANKNDTSQRYIPILVDELYNALDAVENKKGAVITCVPNTIYHQVNRICRKNGLPEIGVHGLRHSFASLAYHLEIPEMVTMKMGGWSNSKTVHEIYTHLSDMDLSKYTKKMKRFYQQEKRAKA